MRPIIWAAAVAALVVGAAAQTADETLIVPPYPAAAPWKSITDKSDAHMLMREWIPADQGETDIKDILTEQAFYDLNGQTPAGFIKGLFLRFRSACTGLKVNGPVEHVENGYPIAYAQIYCARQKGTEKDVDIFLKVLSGKKAFYAVQYEIRRPADSRGVAGEIHFANEQDAKAQLERQNAANDYLASKVQLCPPADGAGPCPVAKTETAKVPDNSAEPADKYDVSKNFGFMPGTTTKDNVRDKLGRPVMETHAKDGRSTMLYTLASGLVVVFLFDKSDLLISTSAYKDNG